MISILMGIYNEKIIWVKEAVDSILKQTYKEFEFIIIVDNPNISESIKEYLREKANGDDRIKLIWNSQNIGLAASLNKGIEIASGEYIARMDSDDISFPDRLEKELDFIKSQDLDIVSANKINIDENGSIIDRDNLINRNPNQVLPYSNIIVHPLILGKKIVFRKMKGYRELSNSEDFDLWLRMIDEGYKIGILNEYLLYYRIRRNSASIERQLEQYYVNKYILQLRKERVTKGRDSFSIENQRNYIKKKGISDYKKKRFYRSNLYAQKALKNMKNNKGKAIIYVLAAFYNYPILIIEKIKNNCFMYFRGE